MKIYIGIPIIDDGITDETPNTSYTLVQIVVPSIAEQLTRVSGGLTYEICRGTWIQSASEPDAKGPFEGDVEQNVTAWFSITYLPEVEETIYASVQQIMRDTITKYELPAKYIHVERYTCEAMHFVV